MAQPDDGEQFQSVRQPRPSSPRTQQEIMKRMLMRSIADVSLKLEFNGKNLLQKLVQANILDRDEVEFIERNNATRLKKSEDLMLKMSYKPEKLKDFIKCLRDDNQDGVADIIMSEENIKKAKRDIQGKKERITGDAAVLDQL